MKYFIGTEKERVLCGSSRMLIEHGLGGELSPAEAEATEVEIKYSGFIRRQSLQQAQVAAKSQRPLPEGLDYMSINTLSMEAREKLARVSVCTSEMPAVECCVCTGCPTLLVACVGQFDM